MRLNIEEANPALDRTMAALADGTRRAILARLALGEARVTELAAPFPMSLNSVSKHIKVLEQAGLVRRRKAGREHFLSFEAASLAAAAAWIARTEAMWSRSLDRLDEILSEPGDQP